MLLSGTTVIKNDRIHVNQFWLKLKHAFSDTLDISHRKCHETSNKQSNIIMQKYWHFSNEPGLTYSYGAIL